MQFNCKVRTFAHSLPVRFLVTRSRSLATRCRRVTSTHRYPLLFLAGIGFLFLIDQAFIATGAVFGAGLFLINRAVDSRMTGDE